MFLHVVRVHDDQEGEGTHYGANPGDQAEEIIQTKADLSFDIQTAVFGKVGVLEKRPGRACKGYDEAGDEENVIIDIAFE